MRNNNSSVGLDTLEFPIGPAPGNLQVDFTPYPTGQPNPHCLPSQFGMQHGQANDMDYNHMDMDFLHLVDLPWADRSASDFLLDLRGQASPAPEERPQAAM